MSETGWERHEEANVNRAPDVIVETTDARPFWRSPFFLVLVLIGAGVGYLLTRGGGAEEEEAEPEPVVAVETSTVVIGTLDVTVDAIGTVEPRPGYVAMISAPEMTRVERILVAVGDRVSAGQALVELDRSVWIARRSDAQTQVDIAQSQYDRAQRLLTQGILPRKDVDAAAAVLADARATLQEAARLETLGTLRSPINGVVVEMNASLSQPVDASVPLVEVIDPAGLEVIFHLPAAEAARIANGASVTFTRGAERDTIPIGIGTVVGISAEVDPESGSVSVRTTMSQPPQLRAGELIGGRIVATRIRDAVLVPLSALVPEEDEFLVYVVDEENVAHGTVVDVGARGETEVQILSGLTVGQVVVTEGAYGVTDGAKVETAEGGEAPAAEPVSTPAGATGASGVPASPDSASKPAVPR